MPRQTVQLRDITFDNSAPFVLLGGGAEAADGRFFDAHPLSNVTNLVGQTDLAPRLDAGTLLTDINLGAGWEPGVIEIDRSPHTMVLGVLSLRL